MPCSGTAACTLRLTTWVRAGQCCGGRKPLLGSAPLDLGARAGAGRVAAGAAGTRVGWPRVSYTFMCRRLPCLAALCWGEVVSLVALFQLVGEKTTLGSISVHAS